MLVFLAGETHRKEMKYTNLGYAIDYVLYSAKQSCTINNVINIFLKPN
jgi:hypothetical protein